MVLTEKLSLLLSRLPWLISKPQILQLPGARNDPSRELQDLADFQHLLGLPETNRQTVRRYFERAGMTAWYDRLVERL